jgi:hypothetical protein
MQRLRSRARLRTAINVATHVRDLEVSVPDLAAALVESDISQANLERFGRILTEHQGGPAVDRALEEERENLVAAPPSPHEMRSHALARIEDATGGRPRRLGRGREETYRSASGSVFYLRTRARDDRTHGRRAYWFGLREDCWENPEHFFVLACDLDFALVVPVREWVPHRDRFSVSMRGTPQQARQPHIYWEGTSYELREATLTLDVRPWIDRFDLLAR